jgi:hypothetical protein
MGGRIASYSWVFLIIHDKHLPQPQEYREAPLAYQNNICLLRSKLRKVLENVSSRTAHKN